VFSNGVAQAPKDQKPKGVTLQRLQMQSTILQNGVSHISKAKTPSSSRQKVAIIKSAKTFQSSSSRSRQNKNARARLKALKQLKVLLPVIPPLECNTIYKKEGLCGNIVFVDGGLDSNPRINPAPPPKNKDKVNPLVRILSISQGELDVPTHHLSDPT